jgi:hypothetical protein
MLARGSCGRTLVGSFKSFQRIIYILKPEVLSKYVV